MNRVIKFRAKRIDNGEWVYGYYLYDAGHRIYDQGSIYAVREHTVGQFTGLKDKNGVEIYEGDIVATLQIMTNGSSLKS